ncbi:MAG: adenylate/guanylate cyclase domain-containing protein [Desulfobulbaceae bacterium]|nr:MAG: adenylate/guanylate cyclase domain-containing protein [Desulfobulbaceae bacterium]
MSKRQILNVIIVLALLYGVVRLSWFFSPRIFETMELQAQDGLLRLSYSLGISQNISPDIVYIDLDDQSLANLPYSLGDSRLYGTLLKILDDAGVAVQLFDMLFVSESGEDELTRNSRAAGNVYLPIILSSLKNEQQTKEQTIPLKAFYASSQNPTIFPRAIPAITAISALNDTAAGLGHINCWPDYDGVYRRLPLFFRDDTKLIPTLSLRAAGDYLNINPDNIRVEHRRVILPNAQYPDGRQKDIIIPFDDQGKTRVLFTGPWPQVFAHYSVARILEMGATEDGRYDLQDELEGTLAIISDVTTGGRDFGPVPFASYSPLSEIHAQFLNSILTNTFLIEAPDYQRLLLDLAILVLLSLMAIRLRGFQLVGASLTITIVMLVSIFIGFSYFQVIIPLVRPTGLLFVGTAIILLMQVISMQHEKRIMQTRLAPYFAPPVMEKILTSPEMLKNVSKKKLTILFSDIVGFTQWSSGKEAQEIHETLNRYFQEMSSVLFSHRGTIDKFMGDGMLAFFGDPEPCEDHAKKAVQAALAMQKKTWQLKKEWELTGGMQIRIRIGIHSGEVVVGDMGSRERMDYTVIGSSVNLAQRLESNCAPDRILVSKDVYEQLDDSFLTTSNGSIQVKGFDEPVEVYYIDHHQNPANAA